MVQTFYGVTTEAELDAAIAEIDEGGSAAAANTGYTINIESTFTLNSDVTALNLLDGSSVTIQGTSSNGSADSVETLNGAGKYSGFFVYSGTVLLSDLRLLDTSAKGGAGGQSGGGGGAGLGGGLFVAGPNAGSDGGSVVLENVTFSADSATGGAGGAGTDAGIGDGQGGGLGGNGASGVAIPGAGTFGPGGAGGSAGAFGGGGGSGLGNVYYGEPGGFGGGGGGVTSSAAHGGSGGYGAGQGGFTGGGGGGLGAGGDIFVQQGASLVVIGGTLLAGTVQGGAAGQPASVGATAGTGQGSSIFLQGAQTDTLEAFPGEPLVIEGTIADSSGQGALLIDDGTVALNGANSSYGGGTTIGSGATLQLGAKNAAGSGPITFAAGGNATLAIQYGDEPTNQLNGFAPGDTIDLLGVQETGHFAGSGNTLVITGVNNVTTLNIDPDGVYSLASDGHGGTDLTVQAKQVFQVRNEADLTDVIRVIDSYAPYGDGWDIELTASFSLSSDLPIIDNATGGTITIDGNGYTIDGQNTYAGLIVQAGTVIVSNLTIADTVAEGGAGGYATGGGGAGLGGGLFVGSAANVTLQNVNFTGDAAIGGSIVTQGSQNNGGGGGGGGLDGGQGGNGGQGGGGGGGIGTAAIGGTGDVQTGTDYKLSVGYAGAKYPIVLIYPVPTQYETYGFPYTPGSGIASSQANAGTGGEYDVHDYVSVYVPLVGYETQDLDTDTNYGQTGGYGGGGGGAGAGGAGGGGGGIGGGRRRQHQQYGRYRERRRGGRLGRRRRRRQR